MKIFYFFFLFSIFSCGNNDNHISTLDTELELIEIDYYLSSDNYDYIVYKDELFQTDELEILEEKRNKELDQIIKISAIIDKKYITMAYETGWFSLENAFVEPIDSFTHFLD